MTEADDMAPILGPIGSLVEQAYGYAGLGFDLFPVNPRDKRPLVSQLSATTDLDSIEAWWNTWPDALIGHRLPARHIILDIDPRHGGLDVWNALKEACPEIGPTRAHYSGRGDGGGHVWYLRPDDKVTITKLDTWAKERGLGTQSGERWSCGIDILRREHRYTILPPSLHPATGRPYTRAEGRGLAMDVQPMPQMLVDLIVRDEAPAPRPPSSGFVDPTSIADWYSSSQSWRALLERHDWVLVGGNGDGDGSRWRHPSSESAHSATIRHGCLFVYSPNTPFEVTYPDDPHGYTPYHALAVLEHGGDMKAAGRAARELKGDVEPAPLEGEPSSNGHRHLQLTPASAIKLRKVKWCWEGRLALGTLGLLAGPEGLGKSTASYTIAADLTRGQLRGEYLGTPKAVLVCATEDSWGHTIAPRLHAAGADLDLVYRAEIQLADDILVGLSLPLDVLEVENAAREVDAALLVLDPLISRIEGALDTHRDGDVRKALEPLVSMADNTNMSILGLIHHNKSGSTDPLNVIMASKAFTAVARSVHTVISDPDDETGLRRFFGTPKNNLGRIDLPTLSFVIKSWTYDTEEGEGSTGQLEWGPEYCETIGDILARSSRDPEEKAALDEAAQWLEDYLRERQMQARAGDAINAGKAAGHAERTIQRARKKLGLEKTKAGFQGAWMWSLPNLPKAPPAPQDSNLGALAPLDSPGHKDAKTLKGAKGVSPHAREAPSMEPGTEGFDPDLYGPDGSPWCRFEAGSPWCTNGSRCLNPAHRAAR